MISFPLQCAYIHTWHNNKCVKDINHLFHSPMHLHAIFFSYFKHSCQYWEVWFSERQELFLEATPVVPLKQGMKTVAFPQFVNRYGKCNTGSHLPQLSHDTLVLRHTEQTDLFLPFASLASLCVSLKLLCIEPTRSYAPTPLHSTSHRPNILIPSTTHLLPPPPSPCQPCAALAALVRFAGRATATRPSPRRAIQATRHPGEGAHSARREAPTSRQTPLRGGLGGSRTTTRGGPRRTTTTTAAPRRPTTAVSARA